MRAPRVLLLLLLELLLLELQLLPHLVGLHGVHAGLLLLQVLR